MKLIYEGKDIYKDVSLNYCVYDSHAEKEADTLVMRFNDPVGIWSTWQPKTGDVVSFEYENCKTGAMFVFAIEPENGFMTIRAMSMPLDAKSKTTKTWSNVTFFKICQEIATRHGLTFEQYSVKDQTYPYISQFEDADFLFLNDLCALEGCQMLVYDKKLIVYNEFATESQSTDEKLKVGKNGVFLYSDNQSLNYGSCRVNSGSVYGEFYDSQGNSKKIYTPKITIPVNNTAEAIRYAKGMLRNINKYALNGSFVRSLKTEYSAGSIINLETDKANMWNGKVFLSGIRHDFVRNQTTFNFRKVFLNY